MLSEARARLANTQGKKAKRKARERQLEEARRLASLQKRRELKAAGIKLRPKLKKNEIDFNADIPFQRKAPAGFYDISDEKDRERAEKNKLVGGLLSKMEGKRSAEEDDQMRRNDAKRQKIKKQESGDAFASSALKAMQEAERLATSSRSKLVLPAPQVTESEIEEIVKIGMAGETSRALMGSAAATSASGDDLLAEYATPLPVAPGRTPLGLPSARTPSTSADALKLQARNLRRMEMSQTPLLGGELDVEHGDDVGTGYEGVTPRQHKQTVQTPNVLLAQMTPRGSQAGSGAMSVVSGRSGISQTPLRDSMGINAAGAVDEWAGSSVGGMTPRAGGNRVGGPSLGSLFKSLPKPKNDFEIVLPDEDGVEDESNKMDVDDESEMRQEQQQEEDMAEVEARRAQAAKEAEERAFRRQSSAVQKDLPRPYITDLPTFLSKDDKDLIYDAHRAEALQLVKQELSRMMVHDAVVFPVPNAPPLRASDGSVLEKDDVALEELPDSYLVKARDAINKESHLLTTHPEKVLNPILSQIDAYRNKLTSEETYVHTTPAMSAATGMDVTKCLGKFVKLNALSDMEQINHLSRELAFIRSLMMKEATTAQKVEKRLLKILGGYVSRSNSFKTGINQTVASLEKGRVNLGSFEMLRAGEEVYGPIRVDKLKEEVEDVTKLEKDAQERYAELVREREILLEELGRLRK